MKKRWATVWELSVAEGREWAARYPLRDTVNRCDDKVEVRAEGGGVRAYTCTREVGHCDDHAAHVPGGDVVAVW